MLACDSARVDVVLGVHGPLHSEIPSALGRALSLHRSTTRKRSIDHRKHRVQPTQEAWLDPKTPFDPERVAAVSNDEKRTEDP
ncbi:hypothetical protein [Enhygromyxa salina]|nr:hypothetical protein [Enhygromyxa salina]